MEGYVHCCSLVGMLCWKGPCFGVVFVYHGDFPGDGTWTMMPSGSEELSLLFPCDWGFGVVGGIWYLVGFDVCCNVFFNSIGNWGELWNGEHWRGW